MQVTFSSEEPLEQVLAVISSLYDVQFDDVSEDGDGDRTVKTRHFK